MDRIKNDIYVAMYSGGVLFSFGVGFVKLIVFGGRGLLADTMELMFFSAISWLGAGIQLARMILERR